MDSSHVFRLEASYRSDLLYDVKAEQFCITSSPLRSATEVKIWNQIHAIRAMWVSSNSKHGSKVDLRRDDAKNNQDHDEDFN
ncbi:hypothetical protein O6P43_017315 [Quillaja saponaria]|uniref:Uncharacterized protein n=1 Tax=Quillaja saponaria TaxID=32244 RepID=A0AAD7LPX4_QUISA|nr:hypothetical protein O6P43_017315 [Quillaja saponaria]